MADETGDGLLGIAGGDRALAHTLRLSLERLAEGAAGENMQWLARDVLAGQLDLRTLVTSSLFQADVTRAFEHLNQWREEVGEAEFQRQADATAVRMAELKEKLDEDVERRQG